MDITTQAVADTASLHLKSAKGDLLYSNGKPVKIILHGPGSEVFSQVESRQTQRALKRMADNDGKPAAVSPEDRIKQTAEDFATLTVGFENLEYPPAGAATGAALFAAVYGDQKLGFVVNQVSKFINDWGNFSSGPSVN